MRNTEEICAEIAQKCKEQFDLAALEVRHVSSADAEDGGGYYYRSLPFCIIDSVFSIGVTYTSTANTVKRYCAYYGLKTFRGFGTPFLPTEEQHTVSDMLANYAKADMQTMAENVYGNRQRTSAVNGILKAEAVYEWARILQSNGIETFQDVEEKLTGKVEREMRRVPGQKSGISLDYFFMLCGDENTVKPDRHIKNFVAEIIGYVPSNEETHLLFDEIINQLKKDYPALSVRQLDGAIWGYMANK